MGTFPIFKSKGDIKRYTSTTVSDTYRKESGITKEQHRFIINECSKLIIEEIVNRNDGFKLPNSLGTLCVIGSPPDVPIKVNHLYRKDRKIYHRNANTGGILYKVTFLNKRKADGRCENGKLLTFQTAVPLRKAISEKISKNKISQWSVVESFTERYNKNTNETNIR